MRQLASIQSVNAVEPIPGADAIEKIRVLGWWVVVKKGEYQVGDRVIYCEIDSLLPERPEFEFLRAGSYKPARIDSSGAVEQPAGFRIRTIKLRGQVSQGICFPLGFLPDGMNPGDGDEVTATLGIIKWEPPPPADFRGQSPGKPFPAFLPKTDETRVQLLEETLARHCGKTFYVTEKLDGTSFTAFVRLGEFGLCSRNTWLDPADGTSALVRLARGLDLETRLRAAADRLGHDVAIQGEVIGPAVQRNKYALAALSLRVFNVLDVGEYRLLDQPAQLAEIARLGLEPVPDLGTLVLDHSVDDLVAFAEGKSVLNPKVEREGVVLRPFAEEHDETIGGRLSFKAINPRFLLKYDE